jgi:hypothetical protein
VRNVLGTEQVSDIFGTVGSCVDKKVCGNTLVWELCLQLHNTFATPVAEAV